MRVVVIGGGAIGSAVALFLKRLGGAAVEVVVVEPDPGLAQSSSARSAGSIRQQFSNPINVRMSQFGHEVFRGADHWLAVDGVPVDLGFVPGAYLFCATAAGVPVLQANHAAQRAAGADVALLAPAEAAARFPWLNTADLALTSLGLSGEGWFDGYVFARALAAKARSLGARWRRGRVVALHRDGDHLCVVPLRGTSLHRRLVSRRRRRRSRRPAAGPARPGAVRGPRVAGDGAPRAGLAVHQ